MVLQRFHVWRGLLLVSCCKKKLGGGGVVKVHVLKIEILHVWNLRFGVQNLLKGDGSGLGLKSTGLAPWRVWPSGESYPCKALSPNQSPLVSSLRCTGPWLSGSSWVTFTCVTSGQSERVSGHFTGVQMCLLPFRCWWWRTCLLSLPVWWCNRHPHSESEDTR